MQILDCKFIHSTYHSFFELTVEIETINGENAVKLSLNQKIKELLAVMGYTSASYLIKYEKFIILDDNTLLCACNIEF